jgi:hypothetical protein
MPDAQKTPQGPIVLSQVTTALLHAIRGIKKRPRPDDYTKIYVSQAVSFFALVYEKIRNAIEYRDEHLVRRAAIERIVRRRIALNPQGDGEGENLIRELLWARYFPNGSMAEADVKRVQGIIDKYLSIRRTLITGREAKEATYLNDFLFQLLTCEIEESLSPEEANRENIFTYFIFQSIKNKLKIEDIDQDVQNAFLLAAIEKTYRKSDTPYQRYHLFEVFYEPLGRTEESKIHDISSRLPLIFSKIDDTLQNPTVEKLNKFVKKQLPPFLILFELIKSKTPQELEETLKEKGKLWAEVELMCRKKYAQTTGKLRVLAVRSLIYIFITKMLLAIALEGPLSKLFYNHVDWVAIGINTVFPPVLMLIIILFNRLPGKENTQRIFQRIVEIIDADESYENRVALIAKHARTRRPVLQFGFTLFYLLTFAVTLFLIYLILNALNFNLISMAIFLFFVSTVVFFAQRIKLVSSEYKLIERDSVFTPLVDFFFMPILALGKFFSNEVAKLNFFTVLFDMIIEAPYKLLIEIIEEWISFTRRKKEEII